MNELERIFAQKKLNKQSNQIQLPEIFTAKFSGMTSEKAQKLFDRYVTAVCGALIRQAPFMTGQRAQVSLDKLINECSTFNYEKQRFWVWNEFKDICPFIKIIEKGNNLTGRNTIVEVNDTTLRKLLDYIDDDRLIQAMFGEVGSSAQPDMLTVDLENLKNYLDNIDYDLAHNSGGKGAAWSAKLRRNSYQAQIVHRVASQLGGAFPQYPKPSVFGRTYYHGLSAQTMSKDVRAAAIGPHYQYDMSAAIYGIKLAIMNDIARYRLGKSARYHIENDLKGLLTYTKEYLDQKDAIRKRLAGLLTNSGRDFVSRLKSVKDALTAIGFGADTKRPAVFHDGKTSAMAEIIMNKDDRERFLADPFVRHFIAEQDEIAQGIEDYLKDTGQHDSIKLAIKNADPKAKRVTSAQILAYMFQHRETAIMNQVSAVVAKQTPVAARIHDALITVEKLKPQTVEDINEALHVYHSLLKLDEEFFAGWRSVAQRKSHDAADAFEAAHRRFIQAEEADAQAFAAGR